MIGNPDYEYVGNEALLRVIFKMVAGENRDLFNSIPDLNDWDFYDRGLCANLLEGRMILSFCVIPHGERYSVWLRAYLRERSDDDKLGPGCILIRSDYGFAYDMGRRVGDDLSPKAEHK